MRSKHRYYLALSIVQRHWAVYRKDLIANTSPSVADPALVLLSLGFGLGGFVQQVEGRGYMQFLAPGLVASTALFTSFFESSYGFYVRLKMESVYKAMLTTPISPRDIVLGEFMWTFCKGSIMALGVTTFLTIFGLGPNFALLPLAALLGGLIALPCAAFGFLASSYVSNINQFQTVYSFGIAPMYYLSGIFFPLTQLPPTVSWIAQASPLTHGVRLMQLLFWQQGDWPAIIWHTVVIIAFTIVLAWWANRRIYKMLVT